MQKLQKSLYSVDYRTMRLCTEFAEIATACFKRPWKAETFMEYLRDGCLFGVLDGELEDTDEEKTIGYAVFKMYVRYVELINFGVHPHFQNSGFGRQMLQSFVTMAESKQLDILAMVSERDVAARKILLSLGFECVRSLRKNQEGDSTEYHFLRYYCRYINN